MAWLQLRLDSSPAGAAALEEQLLASGAVAVTLQDNADQPLLEPGVGQTPLWDKTRLTGLYPADSDMDAVLATFPADLLGDCHPRVEILEDKDWERVWREHYHPLLFGRRLWVCPSWRSPPDPDAVNLLLDPGLAFGTGTHPTTALCLTRLDGMELAGCRVVDYGCGSGILAIAALKLGAREALGVDNDPQALAATRDNAHRNGIAPAALRIAAPEQAEPAVWRGGADLVIANILAGPLHALADTLLAFLRPGGTLLLSGLLESQAADLVACYADRIDLVLAGQRESWVCLEGKLTRAGVS